MNKMIVLISLLASTTVFAQNYRSIEFSEVKISSSWYDACEESLRNLTEVVKLHTDDGKFLLFTGECMFDVLTSSIRTNLEPGSYDLGTYCMYESGIKSNRDTMAYLSNENVQIFLNTKVPKEVTCKEKDRFPAQIKINFSK